MNPDYKSQLRAVLLEALRRALPIVVAKSNERRMPQLVWKLQPPTGWMGTYEERPQLIWGFSGLMENEHAFKEVDDAFEAALPGIIGKSIRVLPEGGHKCRVYWILVGLIGFLWDKHEILNVGETEILEAIDCS